MHSDCESTESPTGSPPHWTRSVVLHALAGACLLWLAQPGTPRQLGLGDFSLGWAGWFAPAFWIGLMLRHAALDRRSYASVFLGGWSYWMLTLHFIRLPHPLTPIGWPLLCGYFAVYLPVFVWIVRLATRRTAAPVWVAAPLVWVALEYIQAHLFTGFQMGALSHTQAAFPGVIQISDLGGAYAVSFVVMMAAASMAFAAQTTVCRVRRTAALMTAAMVMGATFTYGQLRIAEQVDQAGPVVALLQGAELVDWDADWDEKNRRAMQSQAALMNQSVEAARLQGLSLDLAIWPESMFRAPLITVDGELVSPAKAPELYRPFATANQDWLRELTATFGVGLLVGLDRRDLEMSESSEALVEATIYNTAALVDERGVVQAFYDKTHRVPFGEYIPFAKNLPALYYLTPMSGGLGKGEGPVAMRLETDRGRYLLAPSICYESVLPHVIRRHVAQLTRKGTPPDMLVNVTNDAWFWGSSELDLHLACGVFRAVENRRPLAVAANTGLSAIVDGSGRVRQVSTRMNEDVIVAAVSLDNRESFYTQHGDWFAMGCLVGTVVLLVVALRRKEDSESKAACSIAKTATAHKPTANA